MEGGGPHFHLRIPIFIVKMGIPGPHYPRKMGTRVPILPVKWGPGGPGVPILGGPHSTLTPGRCHSGLVPPRHCSGGTNLLAYLFPRNMFASGSVPPGTVARPRKRSGSRKCSVLATILRCRKFATLFVKIVSKSTP